MHCLFSQLFCGTLTVLALVSGGNIATAKGCGVLDRDEPVIDYRTQLRLVHPSLTANVTVGDLAANRVVGRAALMPAVPNVAASAVTSAANDARLDAIAEDAWSAVLSRSLILQTMEGLRPAKLPSISVHANEQSIAKNTLLLARLHAVPAASLTPERRITQRILDWYLRNDSENRRGYWLQFAVTPYQTYELGSVEELLASYPLADHADRERYLATLDNYTSELRLRLGKTKLQAARGIRIPRAALAGIASSYRSLAANAAKSFAVADNRLANVNAADVRKFRRDLDGRMRLQVQPTFRAIADYVDSAEYRSPAPESVGLSQYPGGREFYRQLVRYNTSLDLTPEQIFDYGQERLLVLQAEMAAVRTQVGFSGNHEQFIAELFRRPELLAATPAALEAKYLGYLSRLRPLLPTYFARLPLAPFGVRRLDPASETGMTFGYYQPPAAGQPRGEYRYNAGRLGDRLNIEIGPLIYHELMPGHHMQVSLALENASLPMIRRKGIEVSAYAEGWADYASALAVEMGLLNDPYDHYGQLTNEAFTVVRLIVDVGLNDRGWTLDQARRYFEQNTITQSGDISTELLRYSTDIPAQALSYRIGQRWFEQTRARFQQNRGSRFDIREFHALVLEQGDIPLSVLDELVTATLNR